MQCAFCRQEMAYVHGHAACVRGVCPMFGVNQAECCDGESADNCAASTPLVASQSRAPGDPTPAAGHPAPPGSAAR